MNINRTSSNFPRKAHHLSTYEHVGNVYTLLTAGVCASILGCYIDMHYLRIGGVTTGFVAAGIFAAARSISDETTSALTFLLATTVKGVSISPLVHTCVLYYPDALATALTGTISIFLTFSMIGAYFPYDSKWMFMLSSMVGSVATFWLSLSLMNLLFLVSPMLLDFKLYSGLAVFAGYVAVDTSVMIRRLETTYSGRVNYVRPACDLFGDLVRLFVKLVRILMRRGRTVLRPPVMPSAEQRTYYKRRS
jgi:FtsH-binding integral membrane protein